MATTPTPSGGNSSNAGSTSGLEKLIPILKKWGPRAVVIGIAGVIVVALIGKVASWSGSGSGEWTTVTLATHCQPAWNQNQGWCNVGEFPKGTYRVVPKFEVWQMKLLPSDPPKPADLEFLPVPPQGLDPQGYLRNNEQVGWFLRSAFVKGSGYGALIVKTDGQPFGAHKEFHLEQPGRIAINVNLPMFPANFNGSHGQLTVEVQRRD